MFVSKKQIFLALILAALGVVYYIVSPGQRDYHTIPILVYHNIRPAGERFAGGEPFLTPQTFEEELQYLQKQGYATISLERAAEYIRNSKPLSRKAVVLAFDDSHEGQYLYALPLLREYGYTASFFIWGEVIEREGFLTWDEVRALRHAGMEIGGHTHSHPHFVGEERRSFLDEEIQQNKNEIEVILGEPISVFAYPYGEYTDAAIAAVRRAGYTAARSTRAGVRQLKKDLFVLKSTVVGSSFTGFSLVMDAARKSDLERESAYFKQRIKRVGAEKAHAELKERYHNEDPVTQHFMAHRFGELLYEEVGIEGVAACDNAFVFGCYHSFLGKAIQKNGLAILTRLDAACIGKGRDWLGCNHGMGHGIVAHLGYSTSTLMSALDACSALAWKGPVGGCTGGLFMEYNFRTMLDEKGTGEYLRPLDDQGLHAPCKDLPLGYRVVCYYEQPDWWRRILHNDFVQTAGLCREASNVEAKEKCFIGLGRVIAQQVGYDIPEARRVCGEMAPEREVVLCRAGGFLSIIDYTHDASHAREMCTDENGDAERLCLTEANIFGTVF